MTENIDPDTPKGLSARHLVLFFLASVAVCAVFFSLGFLVGYNERSSRAMPPAERVSGSSVIPPTVNPLVRTGQPASKGKGGAGTADHASPVQLQAAEESSSRSKPVATGAASMPLSGPLEPSPAADRISAEFEPAGPPSSSKVVDTGFTVQVAASHIKHDAEALVAILKDRGYPVFLVAPEYGHTNDNLFRVQVGPFASRDEAEKVRTKLAKEGLFRDLFIRH